MTFKLIAATDQVVRRPFTDLPNGSVFRIMEGGLLYMKVESLGYTKAGYPANAINLSDMAITNVSPDRSVYPTTIEAKEVQP